MLRTLIFITLLGTTLQLIAGGEWSISRDKEDIKIYTRPYDGYKYKEYKGITVMDGSVEDVVQVLKDVDNYHLWSYNCIENSAKILSSAESKGEYYIYMEIKAPIVSNRDVVSVYKFHPPATDGSVLVEFWTDADYIPKKKGKVRIPELKGFWKISPVHGGKIKVVHQAFSHPGGSPPAGLVNNSTVAAPFHMLKEIRELIR